VRKRQLALAAAAAFLASMASGGSAETADDTPPASVAAAPPLHEDLIPLGPSVEERLAEIRRRIQEVLIYPPIARVRNLSGEALIEFEITQEGRAAGIRTARSSGSFVLDRAAERAVAEAAPLPRVYGPVSVPVSFALRDD
jgi:TonB family protein